MEARTRLSPAQYWNKVRYIRKRSKITRTEEKYRLRKKFEWLKKTDSDCECHYICKWMEEHREVRKDDREIN